MLILTRRIGEKLIIGDTVAITMLAIKGHQIRIGIEAPADVSVHREEIYQRILKETAANPAQAAGLGGRDNFQREAPRIEQNSNQQGLSALPRNSR